MLRTVNDASEAGIGLNKSKHVCVCVCAGYGL